MGEPRQVGELQIEGGPRNQESSWRAKRICWAVIVVILSAALAGLLGPGPLSHSQAGKKSLLYIEYDRFSRYQGPAELKIEAGPEAVRDGKIVLAFNSDFIESIEIERIEPEPASVKTGEKFFHFEFESASPESALIFFRYKPNRFGSTPIRIETGGGALDFKQFNFP